MGRFYKTTDPRKIDFMMDLPEEAMFAVAGKKGKVQGLMQGASSSLGGMLEGETYDGLQSKLNDIFNHYETEVDEISSDLTKSKDYQEQRKLLPRITNLKRTIQDELTTGEAGELMNRYSSANKHFSEMMKDEDLDKQDVVAQRAAHFNYVSDNADKWNYDPNTGDTGLDFKYLDYVPKNIDYVKKLNETLETTNMERLYDRYTEFNPSGVGYDEFATKIRKKDFDTEAMRILAANLLSGDIDVARREKFNQEILNQDITPQEYEFYADNPKAKFTQEVNPNIMRASNIFSQQYNGGDRSLSRDYRTNDIAKHRSENPEEYYPDIFTPQEEYKVDKEVFNYNSHREKINELDKNIKAEKQLLEEYKNDPSKKDELSLIKSRLQLARSKKATFQANLDEAKNFSFKNMNVKSRKDFERMLLDAERIDNKNSDLWTTNEVRMTNGETFLEDVLTPYGKKVKDTRDEFLRQQKKWFGDTENNVQQLNYKVVDQNSSDGKYMTKAITYMIDADASSFKEGHFQIDESLGWGLDIMREGDGIQPDKIIPYLSEEYHIRPDLANNKVHVIGFLDSKKMSEAGIKVEHQEGQFEAKAGRKIKMTIPLDNIKSAIIATAGDSPESKSFMRSLDPLLSQIDENISKALIVNPGGGRVSSNPGYIFNLIGPQVKQDITYTTTRGDIDNNILTLEFKDSDGNSIIPQGGDKSSVSGTERQVRDYLEYLATYEK